MAAEEYMTAFAYRSNMLLTDKTHDVSECRDAI
jgi:hypothetical protein